MVAALTLTSCGIGGTGEPTGHSTKTVLPPVSKDPKLASLVPAKDAEDGKLLIANDQTYPPNEFRDSGALVGMDVDIGRAMAKRLGLEAEFQNSSFDGILGGIKAHKYEAAISSFSISADRLAELNLVSYYIAGTSLGTLKGNPNRLDDNDLCGTTIAVQKGTTQVDDLNARNKRCAQQHKPPATMMQFQAQTDVNLALAAKRVQGELADSPVVAYAIKQSEGKLEQVGKSYANAPYGVAVPKDDTGLAKAVQASLQSLMDDGTYRKILEKWGLDEGAIKKAEVNPKVTDYS
ncbi:ABC transporter substrate-binding protein [Sciscionella sediminilitoris]|uniref:ABC transporter substrate-binding protein n=1 Tax=Sciscionella sediminilitoris TaxID=1445613 RepID=UPI0004DF7C32|nr:ABC transporter substrate-binding protein [Sciscionella sp. SE31]